MELRKLICCIFGIENVDILPFWNWKFWYISILELKMLICCNFVRKLCCGWKEMSLPDLSRASINKTQASHHSKWCHLFSSAKKWWQLCQSYVHFNIDTLPVDNFIQHLYETQGDVLTILEVNLLGYPLHDNVPIPRIFKMACTNDYASSTFRTWPLGPE